MKMLILTSIFVLKGLNARDLIPFAFLWLMEN